MKKDRVISAMVLVAGIILLIAGVASSVIDAGLTISGAVLIGSWQIGRKLSN